MTITNQYVFCIVFSSTWINNSVGVNQIPVIELIVSIRVQDTEPAWSSYVNLCQNTVRVKHHGLNPKCQVTDVYQNQILIIELILSIRVQDTEPAWSSYFNLCQNTVRVKHHGWTQPKMPGHCTDVHIDCGHDHCQSIIYFTRNLYGHMSQTGPKKCFIPQNCRKYTNFDWTEPSL